MVVVGFVGMSLAVGPARAGEVYLATSHITIQVPDDWTYELIDGSDGFRDANGVVVGKLHFYNETCAELDRLVVAIGAAPFATIPGLPPGWVGTEYDAGGERVGAYCRDIVNGNRPGSLAVQTIPAHAVALVTAFSEGSDRHRASAATATTPAGGAPEPDATTTHMVQLATLEIHVPVPANWQAAYSEYFDWVRRGDGSVVVKVAQRRVDCATAAREASMTLSAGPAPGWSSVVLGQDAYCRDIVERGQRWSAFVETNPKVATWLLPVITEGLERRRVSQIPTPFERFGPTRFDLGVGRFTNGDPGDFFAPEAWGVSLVVGRAPWQPRPGLTWTYQGRLVPTSVGNAVTAEAGIGVNLKVLAVQAIAGFSSAGDAAPLGLHAGGQVDVLLFYFGFSGSVVWRDGGPTKRIEGSMMIPIGRHGFTFAIGDEWRSQAQTKTVSIGYLARIPEFD